MQLSAAFAFSAAFRNSCSLSHFPLFLQLSQLMRAFTAFHNSCTFPHLSALFFNISGGPAGRLALCEQKIRRQAFSLAPGHDILFDHLFQSTPTSFQLPLFQEFAQ